MQKHQYKLVYIDARGRAEPIRLIFHYFGAKFDDHRISMADFAENKQQAPMHQLPYLIIDEGKTILCQTLAICRYLAKSLEPEKWFGGATKTDSAKVDMCADGFMDIYNMALASIYEQDEVKEHFIQKFESSIHEKLKIQEQILQKSKGDFFVGKTAHWCDLFIMCVLCELEQIQADILDEHSTLRDYYLRMRSIGELKDYINDNWPATKYH